MERILKESDRNLSEVITRNLCAKSEGKKETFVWTAVARDTNWIHVIYKKKESPLHQCLIYRLQSARNGVCVKENTQLSKRGLRN